MEEWNSSKWNRLFCIQGFSICIIIFCFFILVTLIILFAIFFAPTLVWTFRLNSLQLYLRCFPPHYYPFLSSHYFFRCWYNPANLSRLPFWMHILASSFSFYSLYWDAMEIWSTWNLGSPYFGGGGGDTSSPTMAWATRLSRRINWFDNFRRSFIRSKKSMQIFFCIEVKWPCLSC